MTRRVRSAHLQPSPYSAYFWHTKKDTVNYLFASKGVRVDMEILPAPSHFPS